MLSVSMMYNGTEVKLPAQHSARGATPAADSRRCYKGKRCGGCGRIGLARYRLSNAIAARCDGKCPE